MHTQNNMDVVAKTWTEVGFKIRPLSRMVFVKTLPLDTKIGSILLPPKLTSFHGELPHMKMIYAIVMAAGRDATVKSGEQICFLRLKFAWLIKLEDGCMFGWIDENDITGYVD